MGVGGVEFFVHARLVVEAFETRFGSEFEQVFVAGVVFGEQNEVMVAVLFGFFLVAGAGRHVRLDADKRVNSGFAALLVELETAVHHAVVGDGYRGHIVVHGVFHHVFDFGRAVE